MDEVRSRLLETEALETLARAYVCDQAFPQKRIEMISLFVSFQTEKVQRSLCALVKFCGLDEEAAMSCPAAGFVLAFRQGDFLHIKQVCSFPLPIRGIAVYRNCTHIETAPTLCCARNTTKIG